MMYKHILVPMDHSFASKRALKEALLIGKFTNATVHITHILPVVVEGLLDELTVPDKLKAQAQELLDACVAKGEVFGVKVVKIPLAIGIPEEAIVAIAVDKGCDLIVMGSHGRKGIERLTLGSVAEHVIRNSKVPVLCLRGLSDNLEIREEDRNKVPFSRIMVPFDGSTIAREALTHVAIPLAQAFSHSELHLRYQLDTDGGEATDANILAWKHAADQFLGDAKKEASHILGESRVFTDVVVDKAHVADGIANSAANYDVVVMATHGRRGLARLFLGSITEQVLRQSNTPIFTISPNCLTIASSSSK